MSLFSYELWQSKTTPNIYKYVLRKQGMDDALAFAVDDFDVPPGNFRRNEDGFAMYLLMKDFDADRSAYTQLKLNTFLGLHEKPSLVMHQAMQNFVTYWIKYKTAFERLFSSDARLNIYDPSVTPASIRSAIGKDPNEVMSQIQISIATKIDELNELNKSGA